MELELTVTGTGGDTRGTQTRQGRQAQKRRERAEQGEAQKHKNKTALRTEGEKGRAARNER